MRPEARPPGTEQLARTVQAFSNRPMAGGPEQSHNPTQNSGCNQRNDHLIRTDPCTNRGAQLQVAHSHSVQPAEHSCYRYCDRHSRYALAEACWTVTGERKSQSGKQRRKYKPIGDALAAKVDSRCDSDNDNCWPPGSCQHMRKVSRLLKKAGNDLNGPFPPYRLNLYKWSVYCRCLRKQC